MQDLISTLNPAADLEALAEMTRVYIAATPSFGRGQGTSRQRCSMSIGDA